MTAPYFTDDTWRFLRGLARNNRREWFHANKAKYEAHVQGPFLRLVADLAPPLAAISANYRADPRKTGGSLFRVQRDTRFANDKTPYKTWAGARLFHERSKQTATPVFYVHVQPGESFVGAGLWHPEAPALKRVREFLVDNPSAWIEATRSAAFKRRFALGGDTLTRPPRGFDPTHPLIDDLKRKDFVASRAYTDDEMTARDLPRRIERDLRGLAPLVDYLCAALDVEF